ncbi:MAG: AbrB/MazE/SpoVT family DNA-binding domain-containing protein [Deltaproteobacteria bacterium]|nr:MAG: AbrB/MazE/SpoVT family DNA-binding domain-containing protein [Deltaproteobacteria bacterium]
MQPISVKISRRGYVVLPAKLRKEMKLKEGTYLLLSREGERIILQPVPSFTEELMGLTRGCFGSTARDVQNYIDEERKGR